MIIRWLLYNYNPPPTHTHLLNHANNAGLLTKGDYILLILQITRPSPRQEANVLVRLWLLHSHAHSGFILLCFSLSLRIAASIRLPGLK